MKIYSIESINLFKPTNTDYFGLLEEAVLVGLIKATKDQGATILPTNYITETFVTDSGLKGLVSSYTAYYDSVNDGFYNPGTSQNLYIETTTLYDSSNEVSRVVTSALSNNSDAYYVSVSLDGGSTWTTASNGLGLITDFTGTSNGGGNYRLKLRYYVPTGTVYSWSTASSLNVARYGLAGCGSATATLSFGGTTDGTVYTDSTEKWSGSSWATTAAMLTSRAYLSGCGTTSDALNFGGVTGTAIDVTTTELWNGTGWATASALNVARHELAGSGTTSSALSFGGNTVSEVNTTELWNGTAWATTSGLNVARYALAGCGTVSNDTLSIGGYSTTYSNATELWNGTAWATTSALNVAREHLAASGNPSNALSFGGYDGAAIDDTTELWNGTAWATTSALNVARDSHAGSGTVSTHSLCFGGSSSSIVTEIWKPEFRMYGFGVKIN